MSAGADGSTAQKVPMSPRTASRARALTKANILLTLFLGFLLMATAWAVRSGTARDPYVYRADLASFTHLLKDAVESPETVEVTPSLFDRESAMTPQALMDRWDPLIAEAAQHFNMPEKWIRAVIRMESGGRTVLSDNRPITSDTGAMGVMQVEPGTYEEMRQQYGLGADPYDPHDNIFAGAAYLRWLHGRYGYPAMFAAYNDGPGNLEDHLHKGRKFPTETRNYIAGIARMLGIGKSGKVEMAKFTRPDGSAVWIDSSKVSGLRPAAPGEFDGSVNAVMKIGNKLQAIREDVATASEVLRSHGGNV